MIQTFQFARFALVGVAGFAVDSACLMVSLAMGANFFAGRGISYLSAATFTWAFNRIWTFRNTDKFYIRQWGKFISANALGGAINYGAYAALVIELPYIFATHPILAVAAGSLAGLIVNLSLSKRLVFS